MSKVESKQSDSLTVEELGECIATRSVQSDNFFKALDRSGLMKKFNDLSRRYGFPLSAISTAATAGNESAGFRPWKRRVPLEAIKEWRELRRVYEVFERIVVSQEPKIHCAPFGSYQATAGRFVMTSAVQFSTTQFVLTSSMPIREQNKLESTNSAKGIFAFTGPFDLK